MNKNEEYSINYTQLINLCNLKDETGHSRCGATISIDEINDFKEPQNILQQGINGTVNVFSRGGCSVVELIFSKDDSFDFQKTQSLFQQYVNHDDEKKNERILTLIVVPQIYDGCIFISMSDLVYFNTTIGKELKISAAFNNDATQVLTDESVDLKELEAEVELELRREEEALDQDIMELEKEYKELNDRNIYEDNLKDTIGTVKLEYQNENDYQENSIKPSLRRNSNYEGYGKRYSDDFSDDDSFTK